MTPKPSNEVNYKETTHGYQHHSRPQDRHQHDPEKKHLRNFFINLVTIVEKMVNPYLDVSNDRQNFIEK